MDPHLVFDSWDIVQKSGRKDIDSSFYDYGWFIDYGPKNEVNGLINEKPSIGTTENVDTNIQKTLQCVSQIIELCNEHGIEVIFFTNPMHRITYEATLEADWYDFLKGLVQITDFYNFSGINDITKDDCNYIDSSHYDADIGDKMIDAMCYDICDTNMLNQGFGVYVTKDNFDDFLKNLQAEDSNYYSK